MKLPHPKRAPMIAAAVAAAAIYMSAGAWLPRGHSGAGNESLETAPPPASAVELENKIIVGEQAQKNLRLTAKPLKTETFWKTITVPGMVVDRPGISDREVVAPAIGTVLQILHIPGDIVRPGDVLFTLRLASESLHQSQSDLFKTSQDIKLAEARLERLRAAGEGIAQVRLIEVEQEIARFNAAARAYREDLLRRGLSNDEIDGIAQGKLVTQVSVKVPDVASTSLVRRSDSSASDQVDSKPESITFEVRQLAVEVGQQVEAGKTLCDLANQELLAIEGRAFRDEAALLEQSVKEAWPVEVDFQDSAAGWPAMNHALPISYVANTVDPVTRTFSFLLPLENQSKSITQDGKTKLLWRFRTGQRVLLRIRIERLDGVFVVPADAVAAEGPETFVFTQNVNLFERKAVHVMFRDRDRVVIADDGSLPAYKKGNDKVTIPAVVQTAAAQLNRMTKVGSTDIPKGMHVHADGSLHKNEDEGK
jgi:multidrug efflux pump subunit AcrA (membrane-fusion protein)